MRKYEDYKDSGVAWIGRIPNHWGCMKTKWLLHERTEKSVDGEGEPLSMSQKYGLIPTAQMDMIPNGATSYIGAKKTYKGDLVLNKLKAHLGVFAMSAYNGLVSPDYAVYQGTERTHLEYLLYLFKTPLYISEFIKKTTGVAIGFNRLYTDELFSIPTHYPPIDEQKAIADYLKVKTCKIEQYVAQRERERELLDSLRQSEIANVVTKGLNPNAPMKDSGIPWIGMIPEHWTPCRNKDIFVESKKTVGDNSSDYVLLSLTKQGVIIRDLSENKGKFPKEFNTYKIVEPNDIIFCLFDVDETPRTVGLSHNYGMITGAYDVFKIKDVNPKYILYYYLSIDDRKALRPLYKGLRKVVPLPTFMSSKIFLPPLSEQQTIVEYIDAKLSKIDQYMADLQAEIDYLKEFKQRLISDAVTGQICVTEPQKGDAQ